MKKVISLIFFLSFVFYFTPNLCSATSIEDFKAQIEQKEQEIKQLEQQAAAYKKELEGTQSQKNTLNNQLATIANRIKALQADISVTTGKISATSLKIESLKLDINVKQDEIDKKRKEISDVIQILAENDRESLMEIVLTKASFSDFVNQVRYLELLQENVQKNITDLQNIKKDMEAQKTSAEYQKNQLASLNSQLKGQK